jgi:hypothetical protein
MASTNLYFSTVQAMPDDSVVVGGHLTVEGSAPTATLVVHFDGQTWRLVAKIPEVVNGLTLGRIVANEPALGILSQTGFFAEASVIQKRLHTSARVPKDGHGFLEDVLYFNGAYYIGGAHRQVHRFDGRVWSRVDGSILSHSDIPAAFILSLHASHNMFACGGSGFAARWTGNAWLQLATPSNVDLNGVYCTSDGRVFFCGGRGLLLCLRPDGTWTDYSNHDFEHYIFWDIAEFDRQLYVAAGDGLFKLTGDELQRIELPFGHPVEIYAMSPSTKSLWLVGDEFIYQFTGGEWTEHISPSNKQPNKP